MAKTTRVRTGIAGLDAMLGGGLEERHTVLVSGPPGAGKSVLALQYLIQGAKEGEKGVLLSLEKSPKKYFEMASLFGWDLEALQKEGKISIIKAGPVEVRNFVQHMNIELMESLGKSDTKRVAIDSITPFEILFKDEVKRREMLFEFLERLRETNATTIITGDVTVEQAERGLFSMTGLLDYMVDGIIFIRYFLDQSKSEWIRMLSVPKMLAGGVSRKEVRVVIGPEGFRVLVKRDVKNMNIAKGRKG